MEDVSFLLQEAENILASSALKCDKTFNHKGAKSGAFVCLSQVWINIAYCCIAVLGILY